MTSTLTDKNKTVNTVTKTHARYPALLKKIYDPPAVIYYRGTLPNPDAPCFAVVGTRLPTPYGRAVVHDIVTKLAATGVIIVSGMARGIDSLAHQAALETGGRTIAVLGSGINDTAIYPPEHRDLANHIIESDGAILSEYPDETTPLKSYFVARNRIIAGMSVGTLVIEAREKSGSLITARFALDEGRAVFAVPGPITNQNSAGTNGLIKQGAYLVTSADDILSILEIDPLMPTTRTPSLAPTEAVIYALLNRDPQSLDTLLDASKLDIATLSSTLSAMEIKNLVRNVGQMNFIRTIN